MEDLHVTAQTDQLEILQYFQSECRFKIVFDLGHRRFDRDQAVVADDFFNERLGEVDDTLNGKGVFLQDDLDPPR